MNDNHCLEAAHPDLRAEAEAPSPARPQAPRGGHLQAKVYAALAAGGPLTADEVAEVLGQSILNVRPRVSELAKRGLVRDSGRRGRNASGHKAAKWVLV
jgi:predicted ArsR family transcriptional regulator